MIYNWNSTFNSSPSGTAFGSVTAKAIRDTKSAFYERLQVEHAITEGATPIVTHEAGKTSVVGMRSTEDEALHTKVGTLIYDYEASALYAYSVGGNRETVGATDHASYANLDADDHPQYAQTISDVTGALTFESISGITTAEDDTALLATASHTSADHIPFVGEIDAAKLQLKYVDVPASLQYSSSPFYLWAFAVTQTNVIGMHYISTGPGSMGGNGHNNTPIAQDGLIVYTSDSLSNTVLRIWYIEEL